MLNLNIKELHYFSWHPSILKVLITFNDGKSSIESVNLRDLGQKWY